MEIRDVILFVSSTSRASLPPVQFIQSYRLPARVVRLDTVEDRQAAATGKYFQIINVPSLAVLYSDGNIQLFVGQEKIMTWLQEIVSKSSRISQEVGNFSKTGGTNPPHIPTEVPPVAPNVKPKKKSSESKKKPSKKKPSGGKKKLIKKIAPIEEYSEPEEIEFEDTPAPIRGMYDGESQDDIEYVEPVRPARVGRGNRPPAPPTDGLMVGPSVSIGKRKISPNQDIRNIAEQMKRDRQSTLGYKESDLPVSY